MATADISALADKIFAIDVGEFEKTALQIFKYQAKQNEVYREYLQLLSVDSEKISSLQAIPFLPVEFFKSRRVITGAFNPEIIFESSGTTGESPSRHFVTDVALYEKSFMQCFSYFFGNPRDFCILALLPSYLERQNSSLVYMVNGLMKISGHSKNNFFLHDHSELAKTIEELERHQQKVLLIGVSFALLDFAEKFPMQLKITNIMETGGMKGRRKEITRNELHKLLKKSFQVDQISSEYGMTELLSQAYALDEGKFKTPPWMKIMIRDAYDPFSYVKHSSGVINIIDLANIHSCSFLQTSDIGKKNDDGTFEVLGRIDNSEIRGCNLMWNGS